MTTTISARRLVLATLASDCMMLATSPSRAVLCARRVLATGAAWTLCERTECAERALAGQFRRRPTGRAGPAHPQGIAEVRRHAVERLGEASDDDVHLYLLQLVQASGASSWTRSLSLSLERGPRSVCVCVCV